MMWTLGTPGVWFLGEWYGLGGDLLYRRSPYGYGYTLSFDKPRTF